MRRWFALRVGRRGPLPTLRKGGYLIRGSARIPCPTSVNLYGGLVIRVSRRDVVLSLATDHVALPLLFLSVVVLLSSEGVGVWILI